MKVRRETRACRREMHTTPTPTRQPRCGNAGVTSTFVCYSAESDAFCASLAETVAALRRHLGVEGDRPDATVLELLDLVDELASFPFGRFCRTAAGTASGPISR